MMHIILIAMSLSSAEKEIRVRPDPQETIEELKKIMTTAHWRTFGGHIG